MCKIDFILVSTGEEDSRSVENVFGSILCTEKSIIDGKFIHKSIKPCLVEEKMSLNVSQETSLKSKFADGSVMHIYLSKCACIMKVITKIYSEVNWSLQYLPCVQIFLYNTKSLAGNVIPTVFLPIDVGFISYSMSYTIL